VVAKKDSSLIIGIGENENFVASDISAISNLTSNVIFLEDGEIGVIEKRKVEIFNGEGKPLKKEIRKLEWQLGKGTRKNGYEHFMLKEIYEQPRIIRGILKRRVFENKRGVCFENIGIASEKLLKVNRLIIQACGTSWHAGLVGKYFLEKNLSSEFRYRNPIAGGDTLVMAISQSGETADTLAGIRLAKSKFVQVLSLCNTLESTIDRESDGTIYLHAGTEIGVASTKAYTAELLALFLFTIYWGKIKGCISEEEARDMIEELKKIPSLLKKILDNQKNIIECAEKYYQCSNFLFLGRGFNYPTALEGALKLKEISYIHAEGYAAGEMKHGPIALIDDHLPVVCIVPKDSVYEKMLNNIREVKARRGKVIAIATEGDEKIEGYVDDVLFIPQIKEEFSPILTVIPLQLFAYYTAIKRGCNVDQPRNLAKSVTVE